MANGKTVRLKIKRQSTASEPARWEEFEIPWRPGMNIIVALRDVAENPVTCGGKQSTPVSYDANCLEEICGACAMVINGVSRQACSTLIDKLEQPITIEPMSKFPLVRDLVVDRSRLFNDLKKVKAWVPIDGTYDLGSGPRQSEERQEEAYPLSSCISCGNCLEVCPQYNDETHFVGAAVISQVRLFNIHPTGKMHAASRLEALMQPGGIHMCSYAQNCVKVCPKEIPLTESIAAVNRQVTVHAIKRSLGK